MREHLRRDAQLAMDAAAAANKRRYDAKHRQITFAVGDDVWLELGNAYRAKGRSNRKEAPRRQGPYRITRKVTDLAYEIDLPRDGRVHPVVSIQYLSPYDCNDDPFKRIPPPPGPVEHDDQATPSDDEWEIERIIDHRYNGHKKENQYLVRWKGYGPRYDEWKSTSELGKAQQLLDDYHERQRQHKTLASQEKLLKRQRRLRK